METTDISLILTSAIALAAVIGPIISSVITVKSNERTKKYEIYSPKVYAAVQRFSEAYSAFPRATDYTSASDFGREDLSTEYASAYKEFLSVTYEILSLLPNQNIHDKAICLLADLERRVFVGPDIDQSFQELTKMLSEELTGEISTKKKRRYCKDKTRGSK